MPDINFSLEDAIARLGSVRDDAVERVEDEYKRLVTQLSQVEVARQHLNEASLQQLGAAAIGVVFHEVRQSIQGFALDEANGYRSEWCHLIRPLKPGKYRIVVIFTEDEEKTKTPR